jgi:peptide/nickel transport system permease protein
MTLRNRVHRRRHSPRFRASLGVAGWIGLILLGSFLVLAVLGDVIAPFEPNVSIPGANLQPPSGEHLFGTDELGRDQLSRVVSAIRLALVVGLVSVTIALVVGTTLGVAAGYGGGALDWIIGRAMDVLFAFPALILAMAISAGLGPGAINASIAIGVVYVPRFARVARASALSVRTRPYIEAARLGGRRVAYIVVRHVVPNIFGAVLVLGALSMATAQLNYAALSFLGLGSAPPQADFGTMLSRARILMTIAPWLVVFPASVLALLIVSFNLVGDLVRDLADPKRVKVLREVRHSVG